IQKKYGVIDMDGKEILPIVYDNIPYVHKEGIYLLEKMDKTCFDINGKVIISLSGYKDHFIDFFSDNASDPKKRHLFFDDEGKLKISKSYLGIGNSGINIRGNTWINEEGEVFKLPEGCTFGGRFQEGLVCVVNYRDLKYGFMNPLKELVIPLEIEFTDSGQYSWGWEAGFYNGLTMSRKNEKVGFINKKNELVIPRMYDDYDCGYEFENGFCIIQKDNRWGVINTQGKTIIPFAYDETSIRYWNEKRWIIFYNNTYLVLNEEAQVIIPADKYDNIEGLSHYKFGSYSNELARVSKDGLYGFIDEEGNEVIPLIYEQASAIEYDLITVKKDGYHGVIDKNGHIILPLKYPEPLSIQEGGLFQTRTGWIDYMGFEYWED
ncbi:MAG TPA: WG repeat-containing protein, partial [Emticicia sp.]